MDKTFVLKRGELGENILKRGESAGEVGVDPIFKKGWVRYRRGGAVRREGGPDPLTSYGSYSSIV